MKIEMIAISKLKHGEVNPRTISEDMMTALTESIRKYGMVQPIVVNRKTGNIVGGHQRLAGAHRLGHKVVPVVYVNLSEVAERALGLALNKIGGRWDEAALSGVLESLHSEGVDLAGLGFNESELADLLADKEEEGIKEDEIPEAPEEPTSKRGDLWRLGEHMLLCGDSTRIEDVQRVMDGRKADFIFTSPPYNVGKDYGYHKENLSQAAYWKFMETILENCAQTIKRGRFLCWQVGVAARIKPHWHAMALERAGFTFWRQIVWFKQRGGSRHPQYYRFAKEPYARGYDADYSFENIFAVQLPKEGEKYDPEWSHELILTFTAGMPEKGGPVARADNIRTDVWIIPVVGVGREAEGHPAPYPVNLVGSAMSVMTAAGERVFEPFNGAGTTLIAAEKLGRRCHAIEIEPRYVDVTIRRWERASGGKAKLVT